MPTSCWEPPPCVALGVQLHMYPLSQSPLDAPWCPGKHTALSDLKGARSWGRRRWSPAKRKTYDYVVDKCFVRVVHVSKHIQPIDEGVFNTPPTLHQPTHVHTALLFHFICTYVRLHLSNAILFIPQWIGGLRRPFATACNFVLGHINFNQA